MHHAVQLPGRFLFHLFLAGFLVLAGGCGKPSGPSPSPAPATSPAPVTSNAASIPAPAEVAGPGEKVCFACKGEGTLACLVPGCKDGQADCPGPCLKLSKGVWRRTDIDGKPSDVLWRIFDSPDGHYSLGVSEHHLGEVVAIQDGRPTLIGKCRVCGGSGRMKCEVCKGAGKVACPICEGKKFIPAAWTPTDNPYFNRQPDIIRLTDGRVLLGRVAASAGDDRTIVTRDKKILHVNVSDILRKAETNNSPGLSR